MGQLVLSLQFTFISELYILKAFHTIDTESPKQAFSVETQITLLTSRCHETFSRYASTLYLPTFGN
jgi:hypothetical protein